MVGNANLLRPLKKLYPLHCNMMLGIRHCHHILVGNQEKVNVRMATCYQMCTLSLTTIQTWNRLFKTYVYQHDTNALYSYTRPWPWLQI